MRHAMPCWMTNPRRRRKTHFGAVRVGWVQANQSIPNFVDDYRKYKERETNDDVRPVGGGFQFLRIGWEGFSCWKRDIPHVCCLPKWSMSFSHAPHSWWFGKGGSGYAYVLCLCIEQVDVERGKMVFQPLSLSCLLELHNTINDIGNPWASIYDYFMTVLVTSCNTDFINSDDWVILDLFTSRETE